MMHCKGSLVPVAKGDKLNLSQCSKNELEREYMQAYPYASVVGSVMYAQVCTRPDIAYAVGLLGRFQRDPRLEHWKAGKKLLRYLQGTQHYMLTYGGSDSLELVGYSDSDFAGCPDSRKSTSGFVFLLAGGAVSWKSIKQDLTAASTMEAEILACYEAITQAIWLKNFVTELRVMDSIAKPLKLHCDDKAAISSINNGKVTHGNKHMEIKYLVLKDKCDVNKVSVEYVNTTLMIADPLTKAISADSFVGHVKRMGLLSPFSS